MVKFRVTQDMAEWQHVMDAMVNFVVSWNAENFLTI